MYKPSGSESRFEAHHFAFSIEVDGLSSRLPASCGKASSFPRPSATRECDAKVLFVRLKMKRASKSFKRFVLVRLIGSPFLECRTRSLFPKPHGSHDEWLYLGHSKRTLLLSLYSTRSEYPLVLPLFSKRASQQLVFHIDKYTYTI